MRLGNLISKAKRVVDQRGGTEALKQDAEELRNIARGQGSASEKAKRAADALKEPGGRRSGAPAAGRPDAPAGGSSAAPAADRPDTPAAGRPDAPGPDHPDQPVR